MTFGDRADFLPGSHDFKAVPIGGGLQDVIRLTNPNGMSDIFEDGHATLYASWTPYPANDLGHLSPPNIGPFRIVPQQRTEFKKKETREFAVEFRPTSGGSFAARLYVWWDYKGTALYDRTIDYAGYGYPPATAAPGGSTSGRNGAAESFPSFLFDKRPPPLWKMSEPVNVRRRTSQPPPSPNAPAIGIGELLPATVSGFAPRFHEPEAVILGGDNATESIAADYIDPSNGSVQAVALVLRTRHDPYAHTYGVCSRVKGAWMDDVRFAAASVPASTTPATFWETSMSTREESDGEARRELATGFIAYISRDNRRASIDSQWLVEHYAPHPEGDQSWNVRISPSSPSPHVYLASGPPLIESRRFVEVTATNAWQEVAIPLQQFAAQGTDLSDLTRIEIVWEWRDFDESVEIDDVMFE